MQFLLAFFCILAHSFAQMCKYEPSFTELDCLYMPTQWSFDGATPQQMLDSFNRVTAESEEKIRKTTHPTTTKLGEDERDAFDVYGPTSAESLFIWVHGGYWQMPSFTRAGVAPLLEHLLAANTSVASIGYRLASPDRPISAITHDVAKAIEKVLPLFPNATRIVVGGHSAGVQLAFKAVAQLQSTRIDGLALIAGIYDLTELPETIIGKPIGLTAADAKASSCSADEFGDGEVETLILVGDHDTPRFRSQAVEMHLALTDRGIYSQFAQLPYEDHLSIIEGFTQAEKKQTQLLKKFCAI